MKLTSNFVKPIFDVVKASAMVSTCYVILTLGYLLSFSDSALLYLTITPPKLLPPNFWVWTLVTFSFLESRLLFLIWDFVFLHLCGKLIEPLWGQWELLKYFLGITFSTAISCTFQFTILYYLFYDPELLFDIKIHGMSGLNGALVVAVKQILPDETICVLGPLGKLKNAHLPMVITLALSLLLLLNLFSPVYLSMYLAGVLNGWMYLRFYQVHSNGMKGDMAEHFSFAREKALRDLNERLNKAKESQLPAWPSLEPTEDSRPLVDVEKPMPKIISESPGGGYLMHPGTASPLRQTFIEPSPTSAFEKPQSSGSSSVVDVETV